MPQVESSGIDAQSPPRLLQRVRRVPGADEQLHAARDGVRALLLGSRARLEGRQGLRRRLEVAQAGVDFRQGDRDLGATQGVEPILQRGDRLPRAALLLLRPCVEQVPRRALRRLVTRDAGQVLERLLRTAGVQRRPCAAEPRIGVAGVPLQQAPVDHRRGLGLPDSITIVMVNESGASVYSASEAAREEFPDLDLTIRGAISIARRLQDPLAELVKIDPKSIGVGQYQHDLNQSRLARSLDAVVEDCVNSVGVDVNTASAALLKRISGLNGTLAGNIVAYRDAHGAFKSRTQLMEVPRLGEKAFEQAAGFLRVRDGGEPLDTTGIHPESYPLVRAIAEACTMPVKALLRNRDVLTSLDPARFVTERFGLPTLTDILEELQRPGRDPRPPFVAAAFRDDIRVLSDLHPGLLLPGIVTNVTKFGAFVDLGVHQDGLVHISELADRYVRDPAEVVKVGDRLTVRVLAVDLPRRRISLTAKKGGSAQPDQTVSEQRMDAN